MKKKEELLTNKISVRFTEKEFKDLKRIAHDDYCSMASIVQTLVTEYLKRKRR